MSAIDRLPGATLAPPVIFRCLDVCSQAHCCLAASIQTPRTPQTFWRELFNVSAPLRRILKLTWLDSLAAWGLHGEEKPAPGSSCSPLWESWVSSGSLHRSPRGSFLGIISKPPFPHYVLKQGENKLQLPAVFPGTPENRFQTLDFQPRQIF